jgi:hypothetical protein
MFCPPYLAGDVQENAPMKLRAMKYRKDRGRLLDMPQKRGAWLNVGEQPAHSHGLNDGQLD